MKHFRYETVSAHVAHNGKKKNLSTVSLSYFTVLTINKKFCFSNSLDVKWWITQINKS